MDKIKCPHCGKDVELTEAIIHELSAQVRQEENKKLRAEFEEKKAKELALERKKALEEAESKNKERDEELKKEKEARAELEKKQKDLEEENKKNAEKIKEQATKEADEKHRLDRLEWEKRTSDQQKLIEELQRKGKQGSQQLQGEVLELDLEQKLKETFPSDEFIPVPKGVEGADIWQKVRFNGKVVGSIIWETKRTRAWSNLWSKKLKNDAGKISASEAIIVSITLPDGITSFDRRDGVWITTYEHAISICRYVRFLITTVATVKSSATQTDEEWGQIRDYMLSDAFKHRMQAHFDGIKDLRQSLDAEKRSTILRWKKQESQIEKLDNNTTNFYGELKARVSDLPEIRGLESPILEEGDDQTDI